MNVPRSGVTFLPLQLGQMVLALARSDMVMISSNGFLHVSHMNSYLGMVILLARSPRALSDAEPLHRILDAFPNDRSLHISRIFRYSSSV